MIIKPEKLNIDYDSESIFTYHSASREKLMIRFNLKME